MDHSLWAYQFINIALKQIFKNSDFVLVHFVFLQSTEEKWKAPKIMSLQRPSCDEHYAKFPQLDRNEVLKLIEWHENQPHLPNCSGLYWIFEFICFFFCCKKRYSAWKTRKHHTPPSSLFNYLRSKSVFSAFHSHINIFANCSRQNQ